MRRVGSSTNRLKLSVGLWPRLEIRGLVPSTRRKRAFAMSAWKNVAGDASNIHWSIKLCWVFS
jgi:hypothetical protein